MDILLSTKLRDLKYAISTLSDANLNSEREVKRLVELHKISTPKIFKEKLQVTIKKQVIHPHNVPANMHFVPGAEYEFVRYQIPINNAGSLPAGYYTSKQKSEFNKLMISYDSITFDALTEHQVVQGNQLAQDVARELAKSNIESFEKVLKDWVDTLADFNENVIPATAAAEIKAETEKRRIDKETKDRLRF